MQNNTSGTHNENYIIRLVCKSRRYKGPAELRIHQHALHFTAVGKNVALPSMPEFTPLTIRREQLIDCRPVPFRRRLFANHLPDLVRLCYLEFTDSVLKKRPHSGYGFVLKTQVIYLSSDRSDAKADILQRIKMLMSAKPEAGLKPYLIFINPCSGSGKALTLFKTNVAPMFHRLNVPYELFKTEYPGHAEMWIRNSTITTLARYRALVVVSGDGLAYELLNGLAYHDNDDIENDMGNSAPLPREMDDQKDGLRHPYAQKMPRIPLGFLPAGGGNATASAICYHSGLASRENSLVHSAFILSHFPPSPLSTQSSTSRSTNHAVQRIRPLDAILFETADPRSQRIGILSIEWGGLAELDLLSERFRWLGKTRFPVATLLSMTKNKEFQAKISYLPVPKSDSHKLTSETSDEQIESIVLQSLTSYNQNNASYQSVSDEILPWGRIRYAPNGRKMWARQYLPAMNEPIPTHWEKITDTFWAILITNHSHIASDVMLHPKAAFDNGQMHMILVRSTVKCGDLISLLEQLSTGEGIRDTAIWKTIPVLAVRVESELQFAHTMLDGERVSSGPFQAELIPRQFSALAGPSLQVSCG